MGGGQYTMGRGVHLPWVGDLIKYGLGCQSAIDRWSIYHGYGDQYTMDRGSILNG